VTGAFLQHLQVIFSFSLSERKCIFIAIEYISLR